MNRLTAATAAIAAALACAVPAAAATPVYKGKLEVRHSDDFRHARGQTTWTLRTAGGRRIPIRPTAPTSIRSGSPVSIRGRRSGGWIEGAVRRRGGSRIHAATALGSHNVAVVLVNFSSDTREPWTPAYVTQRIFTDTSSTAAFYDEQSHGDVTVTGHVFGWYTIAGPTAGCDVDAWASQARAAVTGAGESLAGYDNVMFVFPQQSSCGWAGLGELPGSQTWLNGDISVRVAAHELGHNLGLHHASSYYCTSNGSPVAISSSCSANEYGDPYDVMGLNAKHSNAWHLAQLGVVRGANVQTISASGTYTLKSSVTPGAGTELLRIPSGGSPARWYDLSIRQAQGSFFDNFASSAAIVNGVSIHWDRATSSLTQSLLLDATPGSASAFNDAPLPQGSTFSDGSTSITATSVSPGAATVSVVMGTTTDVEPPSQPGGFTTRGVEGGADLSWGASADNVGVAGYRILRDDAVVATTTATSWSDRNLAPGSSHKYQVTAYDAAGNGASTGIRWVTVPAAPDPGPGGGSDSGDDVTAPVVKVLSPPQRASLRGRARISALATDDDSVALMTLSIDGRRVAAVRGAELKRTWLLRNVRPGAHQIRVRAYDATGNDSSRVIRVRVLRRR